MKFISCIMVDANQLPNGNYTFEDPIQGGQVEMPKEEFEAKFLQIQENNKINDSIVGGFF